MVNADLLAEMVAHCGGGLVLHQVFVALVQSRRVELLQLKQVRKPAKKSATPATIITLAAEKRQFSDGPSGPSSYHAVAEGVGGVATAILLVLE
jgi:hypothetical protein